MAPEVHGGAGRKPGLLPGKLFQQGRPVGFFRLPNPGYEARAYSIVARAVG